jgi:hypothetical protein
MIYNLIGQVFHVSEIQEYGKNKKSKKKVLTITIGDDDDNKTEYIPVDFIEEDIKLIEEINLGIGDMVEISFSLKGRKFIPESKPNELINYLNLKGKNIKILM